MIRVFGSKDCSSCKAFLAKLHKAKVAYSYVDADDEKNEDLCDSVGVDHLPHTQILAKGVAVHDFVGSQVEPAVLIALNQRATKRG